MEATRATPYQTPPSSAGCRDYSHQFPLSFNTTRGHIIDGASVILHGSTTAGFDDAVSDLDVWVLVGDAALKHLGTWSNDRFFQFSLDGKPATVTLHTREEFAARLGRCDLPLIAELRHRGRASRIAMEARRR
jgi:hypothetical protein